jgi:(1->4)-alpha-D-glucan 1-alpha-D-glucosylmutase
VGAPRATYRLQLRPGFGFDEAASLVDFLAELGVSHAYTSPYLQAAPGSEHGYDVVDPTRVSDDLGGPDAHRRFVDALVDVGLGQVIDVVPNHMAVGTPATNRWWWDVLRHGRSSRYAGHFDIEWDAPGTRIPDRLLVPVLGDHYGRVLERGEIRLTWSDEVGFTLTYADHVFPVSPESLAPLLEGGQAPETVVEAVNADVEALDALCEAQHFRLAHWRTAGDELDYRRFFDITTLIGLRVEEADVFADTHQLVLRWLADGEVQGLRIDHPDGLADPGAYFELLRAAAPGAWIVVEKILEPGEPLPEAWPVDGTTGYDHCHVVTRLFHDARGWVPLRSLYETVTGDDEPWDEVVHSATRAVLDGALATDVERLTATFLAVAEGHRRWRDFTRRELRDTLVETAAAFPVYRTYVTAGTTAGEHDREVIRRAGDAARARRPDLDPDLFTFLELVLTGDLGPGRGPAADLRTRFQQLTSPARAKGVEDTVLYDRVVLASLNEVGADPTVPALDPDEVHAHFAGSARTRPASMLALSTHDTKRSEDVRARLAVLSEVPGAWAELVDRWTSTLVAPHRSVGADAPGWPDPRLELLLLQTLVGAHPLTPDRAVAYLAKATKEAKRHTSWTDPVPDYDAAVEAFVRAVLGDEAVLAELGAFADLVVGPGRVNSLGQKLVTLTAPGVPDLYQGSELWDLSLVDPDNRRPVDFELRRRLLAELPELPVEAIAARGDEGLTKLHVVHAALRLRADHPEWFDGATYEPVAATGSASAHAFAFARGGRAITVVTRLPVGLDAVGGWGDTTIDLPAGRWFDVVNRRHHDGGPIPLADLLAPLPVALLRDDVGNDLEHGGGGG